MLTLGHFFLSKRLLTIIGTLILLKNLNSSSGNDARNVTSNVSINVAKSSSAEIFSGVPGQIQCTNASDFSKNQSNNISNYSYTVLYDYLNGTGAHNFSESITIGFLGAYRQAQVVLGALPLAVEAVNEDKGKTGVFVHNNYAYNPFNCLIKPVFVVFYLQNIKKFKKMLFYYRNLMYLMCSHVCCCSIFRYSSSAVDYDVKCHAANIG